MDIEGLRLLIRVVEFGSVQKTAHILGISRTSLRRKLEGLEAEVGSELFVRSTVGVTLTPAGAIVLKEGRTLLERYERMVASAKSKNSDPTGRVLIVIPSGAPHGMRVGLIRMLHEMAPGICLQEVEHAEPLDFLHEPFDLMFHFGAPPDRGQWFSRVLTRIRLMPLASEAYLEAHGRPSSLAELSRHRLLGWQIGKGNPREWPLWEGGVIPVEPIFCSRDGQVLHLMAQEGLGILMGDPNPTLLDASTPLIPVLADELGCELTFRCLSPTPSSADPRIRTVLEGIQTFMAQLALG